MSNLESLEIAGVPIVLRPPADPSLPASLIVLWHGFGIPNSEEQLAQVLPLQQVQAWKAYLGLPSFGKRLPFGGLDEIMRRQMEDYVLLQPTAAMLLKLWFRVSGVQRHRSPLLRNISRPFRAGSELPVRMAALTSRINCATIQFSLGVGAKLNPQSIPSIRSSTSW